jgi:hypothetical protein
MQLMRALSPYEQEAITALAELNAKLSSLSDKSVGHPDFTDWKSTTEKIFEKYFPESVYCSRFAGICFDKPPLANASHIGMGSDFMVGLAAARKCLEAAIERIEQFGLDKPST